MTPVSALSKSIEADILGYYPDLGNPESETWCPQRFASAVLRRDFLKKQRVSIDRAETDRVALETFLNVNERVGQWRKPQLHEWEEELWGTFKSTLYNFFYPCGSPLLGCLYEAFDRGDLGPGANIGAGGSDFYTKLFSSVLTVTDEALYETYRRLTNGRPAWRDAEETRIASGYKPYEVVDGNRLNFVPKNDRTSRVIATEPTLNMFFQRGVSNIIEDRLRSFGIDLAIQPDLNRELARLGSQDDSFVTIDLSSASDSFSLAFCEEVIPRTQLAFLRRFACRVTTLPSGVKLPLNMLSTMGNGYTFSFQTAVFTCMVLAAFRFGGFPTHHTVGAPCAKNWGVFGDDIVVPKHVSRYVLRLLEISGFRVNSEKTFLEGPFRESCGGDYLLGCNVRPVYAISWHDRASRHTLLNRLLWWASQHHSLHNTIGLLVQGRVNLVPPSFPDFSGVRCPFPIARDRTSRDHNGSIRFRYTAPERSFLTVEQGLIRAPKGSRQRKYNPGGLMLAFLRGDVRAVFDGTSVIDTIGVKSATATYRNQGATVPNWDSPDPTGVDWLAIPQMDWESILRKQT